MASTFVRAVFAAGTLAGLAGCAGISSQESAETESAAPAGEPGTATAPVTATEAAVAARRTAGDSTGTPAEMARLVDQLNEAARELATLRTANARLRAERERAPAAPAREESASRVDPTEERLASTLRSYTQFRKEIAALVADLERLKKAQAEAGADSRSALEQARQAKSALSRVEDELRGERRRREEAEAAATQLREQLRTIARAMADAGLNADKLTAQAEGTGRAGTSRSPSRYTVRSGDTLERIADRVYGDSSKWRLIYDANRSRLGPDGTLEIGMELSIPRP